MSPSRLEILFKKLVTGVAEDKTSIIRLIHSAINFQLSLENAEWSQNVEEVRSANRLLESIKYWFSEKPTDDEDNHKDEDKDKGKGKGKGKDNDKDKDKDKDKDNDIDSDKDLDNNEHDDEDNEHEITDYEDEDDEAAADSSSGSDYCQIIPNFVAL